MNMPHVQPCNVIDCAYNPHRQCHAMAIAVGDSDGALCDTFWTRQEATSKAGDPTQMGHVGACRMAACMYNDRLQCNAEGVTVGQKSEAVSCLTFNPEE